MNLGSTIIGAIFTALCLMPFVIMSINRKKKEKKMLCLLKQLAIENNCQINQYDFLGALIIGIDDKNNTIFFIKKSNESLQNKVVKLEDIQSCKIHNKSRVVNNKVDTYSVIDLFGLSFVPIENTKSEILLEFYNSDENLQLSDEIQNAEKWLKIVKEKLKK